jgi:hypothetical protein
LTVRLSRSIAAARSRGSMFNISVEGTGRSNAHPVWKTFSERGSPLFGDELRPPQGAGGGFSE